MPVLHSRSSVPYWQEGLAFDDPCLLRQSGVRRPRRHRGRTPHMGKNIPRRNLQSIRSRRRSSARSRQEGSGRRSHQEDRPTVSSGGSGAEFEVQINDKILTRLQMAITKASVADETARAAGQIAQAYQAALKEAVTSVVEAAGYDMPDAYQLNIDTSAMMMKIVEVDPNQPQNSMAAARNGTAG